MAGTADLWAQSVCTACQLKVVSGCQGPGQNQVDDHWSLTEVMEEKRSHRLTLFRDNRDPKGGEVLELARDATEIGPTEPTEAGGLGFFLAADPNHL